MKDDTTLIAPLRSPGAAFGGGVAAVVIGATCALLAADSALTASVRVVVGAIGGLLTAALVITSARLAKPRGGLLLNHDRGRVGIGLTGADDVYWIPLSAVEGVGIRFHDVLRGGASFRTWSAELICADRPSVLLVEASERDAVERVVEMLTGQSGLPRVAEDPAPTAEGLVEATPAVTHTGVRRGGALTNVFALFGASLSSIGVALFAQLRAEPMVAVFVAPVILLLGAVLLGIAAAKRFAAEEVELRHNQLFHRWRLANFTWSESYVSCKQLRWRLRVQAMKGAHLEAIGSDGSIAIGAGATTRSHVNISALNRLPARLTSAPSGPAPTEP